MHSVFKTDENPVSSKTDTCCIMFDLIHDKCICSPISYMIFSNFHFYANTCVTALLQIFVLFLYGGPK